PSQVLVVANKNAARSVGLAKYYMHKRDIPEENLLEIWVTDSERCSREEFDGQIAVPIQRFVQENKGRTQIRCLLLMYGVPMKAAGPPDTEKEKAVMDRLKAKKQELSARLNDVEGDKAREVKKELQEIKNTLKKEKNRRNRSSSVDSELALVMADEYSLSMWQPNPFFVGFQDKDLDIAKEDVLLVSRLDGPDSETVKRVINDSLEAEENGLDGTAYFDARWPAPKEKKQSGYGLYDQSLHLAAGRVEKSGKVQVVVDDSSELFQPGDCPEAALYCGWYKLANYVDAFAWQTGAVGYHIASQECQSLKRGNYWCKRMLEEGVAATLGPVGEPYVQSFPLPEVFFAALMDGRYTLAEAYALAVPYWSWKMVLVGDPLYRPFGIEGLRD
ncbi:MAG: TIGR03790 family protein, partial [Thermodesulfobacteriota bacterium]